MIGLFFLRIYRRTIAAGSILALAWWVTGAAPLWNATTAPGLMNSAPQVTVNRFHKSNRLPMTKTPAAVHDLLMPQSLQNRKKLLLRRDPAFAPIASLIYLFGSVLGGAFWMSRRKRSAVSSLGAA